MGIFYPPQWPGDPLGSEHTKPVLVPDSLFTLRGPRSGPIAVPEVFAAMGLRTEVVDVSSPIGCSHFYAHILTEAISFDVITDLVNKDLLRRYWPQVYPLTASVVRYYWEQQHPSLAHHRLDEEQAHCQYSDRLLNLNWVANAGNRMKLPVKARLALLQMALEAKATTPPRYELRYRQFCSYKGLSLQALLASLDTLEERGLITRGSTSHKQAQIITEGLPDELIELHLMNDDLPIIQRSKESRND